MKDEKDKMILMLKRFKNHCELHGWPSKSFEIKVKKYLKQKQNENVTIQISEK